MIIVSGVRAIIMAVSFFLCVVLLCGATNVYLQHQVGFERFMGLWLKGGKSCGFTRTLEPFLARETGVRIRLWKNARNKIVPKVSIFRSAIFCNYPPPNSNIPPTTGEIKQMNQLPTEIIISIMKQVMRPLLLLQRRVNKPHPGKRKPVEESHKQWARLRLVCKTWCEIASGSSIYPKFERKMLVCMAKVAEEAEQYEGMLAFLYRRRGVYMDCTTSMIIRCFSLKYLLHLFSLFTHLQNVSRI